MSEVQIRDLRDWMREVEGINGLLRITKEVDPVLEMSTLAYMNGKNPGQPTLLFEKAKGYNGNARILFNPIGDSIDRLSLAMRAKPGRTALELVEYIKDRFTSKIPPVVVKPADAPVYENEVYGDAIDLTDLPVPQFWPNDGGLYIGTSDAVITQDPETGRVNIGCYRQMLEGKSRVGYYASPGKDTFLDRAKWWAKGEPCPVVCVYGVDPLLQICASTGFPKQESEYDYAGGIQGAPVEVVPGKITGLPIPARAEFVVEGYAYPGQGEPEGPLGEFTGYYGREGKTQTPSIDVKAVYFRNNPVLTAALAADVPGSNEMSLFFSVLRAARVWRDLLACGISGVQGVWSEPAAAAGYAMTVVSLKQAYPGHAQQAAAIAAQCSGGAYFSKFIFVVDEDVDPSDLKQVIWAAATRVRVSEDIDILRNTWSTYLDPSKVPMEDRPFGSKALIYACKDFKHIDNFPKRSGLSEEQYRNACSRWNELGLPGQPPRIAFF